MKLNKYWESFFPYVLVVPTTLKKVFSRFNVQLLYSLLFFATVVVIAALISKVPIQPTGQRKFFFLNFI